METGAELGPGALDFWIGQRMVWLDVRDDSLRWEWQRSTDDGASWQVSWAPTYTRGDEPGRR